MLKFSEYVKLINEATTTVTKTKTSSKNLKQRLASAAEARGVTNDTDEVTLGPENDIKPKEELISKDPDNPITEALNKEAIKAEGEDAKEKAMKRRITNEIVRRKKKMKALQTLTELDGEENDDNAKKIKGLQSEIKQLEGMMGKLDKKKITTKEELAIPTPTGTSDSASPVQKDQVKKAAAKGENIRFIKK